MPQCRSCAQVKSPEAFYTKGSESTRKLCKDCHHTDNKREYLRNKAYYNQKSRASMASRKMVLFEYICGYFSTHPCVDCGETHPIKLQFDHVTGVKISSVSQMISGLRPLETIINEIAKCEVRCANCHMMKTALQQRWGLLAFLTDKQKYNEYLTRGASTCNIRS